MGDQVAMEARKGKGTRRLTYGLTDFYLEYKRECRAQYGKGYTKKTMSRKLFMSVMRMYFAELAKFIILNRKPWKMPKRLGYLGIAKYKCAPPEKNNKHVRGLDKKITEENKDKLRYFWNTHYMDHYFVWRWIKKGVRGTIRYVTWYGFKPTKGAMRELSDYIYACSLDPKIPDYDVENMELKRVLNPLELPAP